MLIACVQSDVSFGDPEANLTRVLRWMNLASKADVVSDLVVFPECMLSGYVFESRKSAMRAAIPIDSPLLKTISTHAAERDQFVVIGFLETAGDQLYNACALIGPQGIVGCYRKIHLPHLGVDRFVDAGDRPYIPLTATPRSGSPSKIGLAICYDGSFPEPIRALALAGADIVALATNWPNEANHTPEIIPPARSMENHLYFVAANRVGTENGVGFCGRSSICGPDGVVLAKSNDDQESLLFADVDVSIARNKQIRRTADSHVIHRFKDRRPEFYKSLLD